jgi:hypothetical protein
VPKPAFRLCFTCQAVRAQLSKPIDLVVPISLSRHEGQLYRTLMNYARNPEPEVRREAAEQVASLILRFLGEHGDCLRRAAGRPWSRIAVVPSSREHSGPEHPLETALLRRGLPLIQPLRAGPDRLGPMVASDRGYEVTMDVEGMSLLLVDDVLNTSARLQSAATALRLAGADVVAGIPVARLLNPEHDADAQLLVRAENVPFDFGSCALCGSHHALSAPPG